MAKFTKWKILLTILVAGFALYKAYPPLDVVDESGTVTKKGKLNLGLDLQGGMHVVLRVDASKLDKRAKEGATERALASLASLASLPRR